MRGGGAWLETQLVAVEVGPGGQRPQSVTVGFASRFAYGRRDEVRLEGAGQLRVHLWRTHRAHNLWVSSDRRYDPNDPNLRQIPCGNIFHTQQYDGRGYSEAFSVGVLLEGTVGGEGHSPPNATRREEESLPDLRWNAGFGAGLFARYLTPFWVGFNLDVGWENAFGASGPYLRAGLGLPFDLSVDRNQPRLPDQP